jgi:acyl-CoA thioesterase FadM
MTAGLRIRLGARAARIEEDVFARMASAMLDGIGVLGFLAVFEQFATASDLDLSACPGRALVIAGSRDPGIAGERADWLHRAVPHAVMDVDPDYSHFCHLDQPELIGPLVADFLRAGPPSERAVRSPQKGTASMGTLEGTSGPYTGRPRYEGANINTFIGFKNFTALAEDAVLHHLRELGFGPQGLFERYGLGATVVHSSVRLTATMHTDDLIVGSVTAVAAKPGQGAAFDVKLATRRGGEDVKLLNGRMRVQLVAEKDGRPVEPVPAELAPFVVAEVATAGAAEPVAVAGVEQVPAALAAASGNDFVWSWKIPYFACHYYTRIQHSAYVKLLEEAVDRYLEHVGLPITGLLEHRDWIPVVSRARVDLHADAFMGEELLITFAVDDVIKDSLFTARMECRVLRGDRLVHIASATIMHGYVLARGEDAFQDLVVLDAPTQAALLGGAA